MESHTTTNMPFHKNEIVDNSPEWNYDLEDIVIDEKVDWLTSRKHFKHTIQDMQNWIKQGATESNINFQESVLCDPKIIQELLKAKSIFKQFDEEQTTQARYTSNPFETVHSMFFMNRAALKMANIDAATDFMFTNIDSNPHHRNHKAPYYFCDVCAGPGGFTEYILWRKKWSFKGFGFTLRNENDFKLNTSECSSSVSFTPLYGNRGDGNVCCPENIQDFKSKVFLESEHLGVHFVMSDGGFAVDGNEGLQEILSKKIYISQCLVALEVLRTHGHFVTKLFDVFTPFSIGLLFLVYQCFEKIAIIKPNASRPANSERYFIGYSFRNDVTVSNIKSYLTFLVKKLWDCDDDLDILEIVPTNTVSEDKDFCRYLQESNEKIAKRQILYLKKLRVFCKNPVLSDNRRDYIRKQLLQYWRIPDRMIKLPKLKIRNILDNLNNNTEILHEQPKSINSNEFNGLLTNLEKWYFGCIQSERTTNICNFYAGVAKSKVYRFQCNKWVKIKNLNLAPGTLLYGEFVKEKSGFFSLHVMDAIRLGDLSLADFGLNERRDLIATYCKAINQNFCDEAVKIKSKPLYTLKNLPQMFASQQCSEMNSILFIEEGSFYDTYYSRIAINLMTKEQNTCNLFLNLIKCIKKK